jgi:hypothetical protein
MTVRGDGPRVYGSIDPSTCGVATPMRPCFGGAVLLLMREDWWSAARSARGPATRLTAPHRSAPPV